MWPLIRRNLDSATSIPAAVQRRAMAASRQRLTLRWVVRAMEIIDSTQLVLVRVRFQRLGKSEAADGEHLLQALADRVRC